MDPKEWISQVKAWRDFLLLDKHGRNIRFYFSYTIDDKGLIADIADVDFPPDWEVTWENGRKVYFQPGLRLGIYADEAKKWLREQHVGKPPPRRIGAGKKKVAETVRDIEAAQLGESLVPRIKKLVRDGKAWEALFSLHPLLEHRLRTILRYGTAERGERGFAKNDEFRAKSNILDDILSFGHLADLCFLIGLIQFSVWKRLSDFDEERNRIAHRTVTRDIAEHRLKRACNMGIALCRDLENAFETVVPHA